ncbi:MAG TPA: AsmA-like C-terminal region-containing protein [Bryobacteraceae bacterium]|jgi:hypothetical protein|nr:AsmA-like C-terminal region-containing protein [Bryobacteraceae bacterium]
MLVEQPAAAVRHRTPWKWLWISLGVVGALCLAGILVLAKFWPFNREVITQALEEATGRPVEIRTFSTSYFPPGCNAVGVRFLRHKHPNLSPIITVDRLEIRGSLAGLFGSPKRLALVRVVGMHMLVAPKNPDEGSEHVALNTSSDAKNVAIEKIVADGAVLEFIRRDEPKSPYVLKVDKLAIGGVGFGKPMAYRATLTNSVPPGVIYAQGTFGPWNPDNIGATQVSGKYTYENVQLSHFRSLYGVAKASGEFHGPLSQIETHGKVDVDGFRIDGSDHALPVSATYNAVVNGTNGDVQLNPAVAAFRRTRVEVRGDIAATAGASAKTAHFQVAVPQGRVEDLLYLFSTGEPGMSGNTTANGTFVWPPGPEKFLRKIRMDLVFGLSNSRFTSGTTQDTVDRVSQSAQGEKKKQMEEDPLTVLANVRGGVQMRSGVAHISNGRFQVPGADATIHGSYDLVAHQVDLHGQLDTRGHISDATTGFKSFLLKVVTPLFKKRNHERIIPFDITGSYGDAKVGIDWKHR